VTTDFWISAQGWAKMATKTTKASGRIFAIWETDTGNLVVMCHNADILSPDCVSRGERENVMIGGTVVNGKK
jgi:hypothetical protein